MTKQQKLYIRLVKRPVGFLGALVALLLLSPVFLATMILLHFANKGAGVFFTQERPGKDEKIFKGKISDKKDLTIEEACKLWVKELKRQGWM